MRKKKRNIIFINFDYREYVKSGANKRFEETIRNFYDAGLTVNLLLAPNVKFPESKGYKTSYIPPCPWWFPLPTMLWRFLMLANFLLHIEPSIVICEFIRLTPFFALHRHYHINLIHHVQPNNRKHLSLIARIRVFLRRLRDKANSPKKYNHIFTVSNFSKQCIIDKYHVDQKRITVTWNGVSQLYFDPFDINSARDIDLITIGHFESRKNYLRLIEAIALMVKERPGLRCVFIGKSNKPDSSYGSRIKKLICDYNLEKTISIISPDLTEYELRDYYRRSKVLVFPSLYEGFGMPLAEAMISGCIITCSNLDVFFEIAGNRAIYFEAKDIKEIASTCLQALDLNIEEREKNISFAQKFSWPAVLEPMFHHIKFHLENQKPHGDI